MQLVFQISISIIGLLAFGVPIVVDIINSRKNKTVDMSFGLPIDRPVDYSSDIIEVKTNVKI